ncbi:MAG: diguanylate cyclase [Henriciella sp.]|nr:diguanylate cyclase [Henriciella sp.]
MYGEQSFDAPVIHGVSESPRLEMLQTRLRQAGSRPVPVRGSYLPPDSAPAFIDLVTRAFEFDTNDDRLFVTIGKQEQAPTASEIHLTDIAQIATLPARLSIRQREKQRKREIRLRAQTSEKFGAPVAGAIPSGQKSRVLWLGHDAPFLNAIKTNLSEHNISLVAAISRLTAEDYLVSGAFQTIVLCPTSADDEAAKLLSSIEQLEISKPPKVVLLLRPDLANSLGAVANHADQIVDLTIDLDFVATRLRTVCSEVEANPEPVYGLSTAAQDPTTGLVSREYLESHVEAQMAQADRLACSLSLIAFEVTNEMNLKETAQVIKSMLRDTDLAARLDNSHVCVTLPDTQYRGAIVLARRIEQALDRPINWRVIERRRFHTLKSLLGGLTAKTSLSARKSA